MASARPSKRPGQTIVMFAVMLSVFMGMLALGTDVLLLYVQRRAVQGVADLAALGGVHLSMTGSPSPAESMARDIATKNGYTNGVDGVVVTISTNTPSAGSMRVRITRDVPLLFARILNHTSS